MDNGGVVERVPESEGRRCCVAWPAQQASRKLRQMGHPPKFTYRICVQFHAPRNGTECTSNHFFMK